METPTLKQNITEGQKRFRNFVDTMTDNGIEFRHHNQVDEVNARIVFGSLHNQNTSIRACFRIMGGGFESFYSNRYNSVISDIQEIQAKL